MELRNYIRPILVGLIALGIVILIIVLLVRAFSGPKNAPQAEFDLGNYANAASSATLVMEGPNVLNQNFRSVKIVVNQNQSEIQQIEGYEGRVVRSQTYQSNSSAYSTFLQSLKRQGFSNGTDGKEDYRGFCPFGSRYLYSFNDGSTDQFTYWSTSCSASQGTFKGSAPSVRRVFQNQIPPKDFSSFMSNTGIAS